MQERSCLTSGFSRKRKRGDVSNRLSSTGLPRLCKDGEGVLPRIPGVERGEEESAEV